MVFCADKADIQRLRRRRQSAVKEHLFQQRAVFIAAGHLHAALHQQIGASTTALFYCTLKMAEDRDEGLTRMFFRAFRSNFKPATKLWLILLALGCFLGVDGFVLSRLWNTSAFWTILTALVIGAAVLYAIVLLYAFPLLARFENTTLGILRISFAVGVRYLFCTLLMAFIYAVMGWITVCVFAPAFLLGMGLCAMLCSFLLVKIIHLIGGDPDAADEESHDEER